MVWKFFKSKNKVRSTVDPDEIFMDSTNLAQFDTQQFEGRLEKPIKSSSILLVGVFFTIFALVFSIQLGSLQIKKGQAYFERSENNMMEEIILFADRGIIYDRNGAELAWHKKETEEETILTAEPTTLSQEKITLEEEFTTKRSYLAPGFSHVLGYVSPPVKDDSGKYWKTDFQGIDGLEKVYNDRLKGENGSKLVEVDARGDVLSENIVNPPNRGAPLYTTIDSRIQQKFFKIIEKSAKAYKYTGGAGIIMDVQTGEIITATSYPEYDSEVMSYGKDRELISSYMTDKRKVLLDRTISGLYTPGSIVKPFLALGALNEDIISPEKEILSTGSISVPNPYNKDKPSIFKDWRAHGWTDMSEAIAVSSDVYFYTIGGGFKDQKGLGIERIEEYLRLFGIGQKTGVDLPDETEGNIPSPEWKARVFKNDPWRIGDTYNTSIGQYGFQVTPLEMTRAIGAIANRGKLLTPHFILNDTAKESQVTGIDLPDAFYTEVGAGMREAVTSGTATSLAVEYVKIAGKTGTAQVGIKKDKVNSWIVGFFPYEYPRYAFTLMMEQGPANGGAPNSAYIIRELFDWMNQNTPEYFE